MSIPKKIHYCWFGNSEKPESVLKCINSWKKHCQDFDIIEWNESNYDIKANKYIEDAYSEKKWAFVSDFVRLDVVYKYGGIYLDTDIEVIKSLDELLNNYEYFGIEAQNLNIASGLGFGAERHTTNIKELRDMYLDLSFYNEDGSLNLKPCPLYITDYFIKKGFVRKDETQVVHNCKIYKSVVLSPINYLTGEFKCTSETLSIHKYDASWLDDSDKKIHSIEVKVRMKIKGKVGVILGKIYRKGYRLIYAIKNKELISLITEKKKKMKRK